MPRLRFISDGKLILLLLITIAALFVRFYGIGWGLPYIFQDDPIIVNHAVSLGTGDLNPHFFGYPSLFMYVLLFLYGGYFAVGLALGAFDSVADFARQFFLDPTVFYLIGRTVSAFLGAATVPLVYFLGKRMYDYRVGFLAALFLAFAPAHVRLSHYVKGNAPQAFLAVVSMWFAYGVSQRGRSRDYILSGFFGGLSMSTYYAGVFASVPLLLGHVFYVANRKESIQQIVLSRGIWLGIVFLGLGFLAGTPYALLDAATFLRDVVGTGAMFIEGTYWHPEWYYYPLSLLTSMGALVGILSLAGFGFGLWRRRQQDILLVSFVVAYTVFFSRYTLKEEDMMASTFPFLALLAAQVVVVGVSALTGFCNSIRIYLRRGGASVPAPPPVAATEGRPLRHRIDRLARRSSLGLAILTALIVVSPAYEVIRWDHWMAQKDTRLIAKEWIERNLPPGSKIMLDSGKYYVSSMGPPLQDSEENIRRKYQGSVASNVLASERQGARWRTEYTRESAFYAYQLEAIRNPSYDLVPVLHDLSLGKTQMRPLDYYRQQGVQYVITSSNARWMADRDFLGALDAQAILVKDFSFDPAERPGPRIKVYALGR